MRWVILAVVVAGCGVDGAPFTPHGEATISVGDAGMQTHGNVALSNGSVTIGVGAGR